MASRPLAGTARLPILAGCTPRAPAAGTAAGPVADADPDRHRLAQPARHQLFRLHPDAQPGDPDRAGDDRPDVRDHRQRPRSVDRHLRRLRRLRHRDLAARRAAVRCARPARLDRRLRGAGRADPSPQPALDRRHPRHELRLAGARDPAAAEARRPGAGLAARAHGLQAALRALPDRRRGPHRDRRPCRPDADILRRRSCAAPAAIPSRSAAPAGRC